MVNNAKAGGSMIVEVKSLSFSYGKHHVLKGVDFVANAGEMLDFLGPNGVGKTTLFNCILGLRNNYDGKILIDGESVRSMRPIDLAQRVAYVPQSHNPAFGYSVYDMVLMGTTPQISGASMPGIREAEQAEHALETLDIAHLHDRPYTEISGGERQLTLIARALAQKTSVIIMDEPTANLDYGNSLRVLTKVKELAHEGYTIIRSTHNPDHAFLFADRVAALSGGCITALGTPQAAITSDLLYKLYGVDVTIERTANGSFACVPKVSM